MDNVRTYGQKPYGLALVHGGPGAAGEMAPLARELSSAWGVLEPLQTAASVAGQVEELGNALKQHGSPPLVLIGFSWGAWLGFLLAAREPDLVKKLILIGSGSFVPELAVQTQAARLRRLGEQQQLQIKALQRDLDSPTPIGRNQAFARLGAILSRADAYDPVEPEAGEVVQCDFGIYQKVWPEAEALRKSGELLAAGKRIRCPVVAMHGDHDPHPAQGVEEAPLAAELSDFRFVLLKQCGHKPWIERQAREAFYSLLKNELATGS